MLSGKRGVGIVLGCLTAIVALLITVGVVAFRHSGSPRTVGDSTVAPAGSAASQTPDPLAGLDDSPSPSPSRKPSPSPSKKKATTHPKPSRKPVAGPKPPAVPKKPAGCTSTRKGTLAPRSTVESALTNAASIHAWTTTNITVPANLVYAVAWQESGWQSNVVSCVGAVGLMQVTPDTATFMNNRFGSKYNLQTVTGNADLGSENLQWLIKYFGDVYFNSNYDLTTVDPDNPTLLDAVLAAYNVGFGNVDTKAGLVIPSGARNYANNVEHWMTAQPWQ
jgi:hypothetical protein